MLKHPKVLLKYLLFILVAGPMTSLFATPEDALKNAKDVFEQYRSFRPTEMSEKELVQVDGTKVIDRKWIFTKAPSKDDLVNLDLKMAQGLDALASESTALEQAATANAKDPDKALQFMLQMLSLEESSRIYSQIQKEVSQRLNDTEAAKDFNFEKSKEKFGSVAKSRAALRDRMIDAGLTNDATWIQSISNLSSSLQKEAEQVSKACKDAAKSVKSALSCIEGSKSINGRAEIVVSLSNGIIARAKELHMTKADKLADSLYQPMKNAQSAAKVSLDTLIYDGINSLSEKEQTSKDKSDTMTKSLAEYGREVLVRVAGDFDKIDRYTSLFETVYILKKLTVNPITPMVSEEVAPKSDSNEAPDRESNDGSGSKENTSTDGK